MITKGIVEELKGYQAKVRLPIYDGLANTKNATSNENLSYATVCVTTNLNNSLNVGDIVYVSFEDNDKGKPVILGQLYKEEMNTLADIKLNSANINQLTVNKNASLPQNTSIGSISSKEIAALSGIKDNIQNQIDINLPAINFAESERQKSETDGAITHNLDASVTFAESERQKSKNLLDKSTLKTGAYLYIDGRYENLSEYITFEPISVIPNSTITVSCPNFVSKGASGFVFFKDGVYVSALDTNVFTATVPANANQVIYNFNMAELTLDTAQNAQVEYGSVATDYQPYNGAIVHEKEIVDVEHIETIYEMNTKNTIGETAYTAGIPFSNISISNVDFNKYKYLRFTCRWNEHESNWFGGTITFDLDLQTPYNADLNYISVISNRPSNCFATDSGLTFDLVGFVKVYIDKKGLDVLGYKITYTGERTAYTSDNYLTYFRIEKIEGAY